MRMSVTELGRQTGIHTESIYRMVRHNAIPHARVGKRIFFDSDAMKEFFGDRFNWNKWFFRSSQTPSSKKRSHHDTSNG